MKKYGGVKAISNRRRLRACSFANNWDIYYIVLNPFLSIFRSTDQFLQVLNPFLSIFRNTDQFLHPTRLSILPPNSLGLSARCNFISSHLSLFKTLRRSPPLRLHPLKFQLLPPRSLSPKRRDLCAIGMNEKQLYLMRDFDRGELVIV